MKKVFVIISLLLLIGITACSSPSASSTSPASSAAPAAPATPASSEIPSSSEPELGTRKNPIPIGQTATVKIRDVSLEVTVEEVLKGNDVWTVAKQVAANDTPDDGCEFIVLKLKVKVLSGADDDPLDIGIAYFDVFSSDGEGINGIYAYIPENQTLSAELFSGAEKEGYGARQVKSNDSSPVARYGDTWFALY